MTIEQINDLCRGTFIDLLKIRFTDASPSRIVAEMPVTPDHFQPSGTVHGGALIALAETVGSAGSFLRVDRERFVVFGAVVNSQHLTPAREGMLTATARLSAKTDTRHVWDVDIRDEHGQLISISRVTNSVKPKRGVG